METGEARQSCRSRTRARIEVFSAVMEYRGQSKLPGGCRDFFGVIFLRSCNQDSVIFDAEALQPTQINSEGYLTLTLRHSIPVEDEIIIFPWLIDIQLCYMCRIQKILWEAKSDDMNQLICRTIKCPSFNYLDVSFVVYRDAVEAHLDVYFVDFEDEGKDPLIQVHGTVSASNSSLFNPKAKSFLFHKLSEECVSLKPGKLVPLPLSRRITAVPRQSTLLVHVSIEVGTELGNILVIEEMVKFNPCLDSAEGSIILPNHGKVLVKVSWVDCQTLDEDGNYHFVKEEGAAPPEANFMDALAGQGDPEPQESNVMDCFRDSKVPRVEYQPDVHTWRLPLVEASQEYYRGVPAAAACVDFQQNAKGFVKLRGPNTAIEPFDPVIVVPHLFRYDTCSDQFEENDEKLFIDEELMWDDAQWKYDKFLSKRIQSQFGPIEVEFAVYLDGVEARVDVTLTRCQFPSAVVYGWITAQNSKFGERARSFLFNRHKNEGIHIDVSPCKDNVAKLPLSRSKTAHPIGPVVAKLPLSRSKTVHPVGSVVTITVNLWQSSIIGTQDQPIAKNEIFTFTILSGREVSTFRGDECQVNVGVMWAETSEPDNIQCPYI